MNALTTAAAGLLVGSLGCPNPSPAGGCGPDGAIELSTLHDDVRRAAAFCPARTITVIES
jgi:hypothetical protein